MLDTLISFVLRLWLLHGAEMKLPWYYSLFIDESYVSITEVVLLDYSK